MAIPKVSVIIPCRNEESHIASCIEAIYANSILANHEIEVLVIDGMSDDKTIAIVQELQKKYSSLNLVNNPKQVTPIAFNLGINLAKGEFVQIIGARQLISADYLEKAVTLLEGDDNIWCVGGKVENVYENETSEIISTAMNSSFGVGGGNFRILNSSAFVDTVGTPMYSARVFNKIGLFDESLVRNQDDELNYRVTAAGGKIYLSVDFSIKYFVRAQYKNLKKQYFQYGYWKVYVNKKHSTITTLRQLIPLLFVLFIAVGGVLSFLHPYLFFAYLGVLGLYFLMAFYSAIQLKKNILKLIYTFLILHLSYGVGYLKGLIDFLMLGKKPSEKSKQLSR